LIAQLGHTIHLLAAPLRYRALPAQRGRTIRPRIKAPVLCANLGRTTHPSAALRRHRALVAQQGRTIRPLAATCLYHVSSAQWGPTILSPQVPCAHLAQVELTIPSMQAHLYNHVLLANLLDWNSHGRL
jgi:hypothetical protein